MIVNFSPVNFSFNSQRPAYQKPSLTLRAPLACDSVSFGAYVKKPLKKEIEVFGEENLPEAILKKAKEAIAQGKDEGVCLFGLHQDYYAALEKAQSLEEVKKLYPEFADVKQVSELEFNKSRNSTSNQIKQGLIQGLTPEDTALKLLQHVYCGTHFEGIDNLTQGSYQNLKSTLAIPGVNKTYAAYLLSSRRHLNPEFRDQASKRMKALRQDPDFNAKSAEAGRENLNKINQNPEFLQRKADGIRRMHQDPEYAAKRDAYLKEGREKLYSTPELRAKQAEATRRKSQEYDYANIHSEAMSRALEQVWDARPAELKGIQSEFAKDFPRLGAILTKKNSHQKLDESELGYLKLYYKALYENYPELKEHLSDNFGEAYETAYRTVKKEYETAKDEGRLEELLVSWKKARKK